jgi:nucleotide-binding universal stress UspA family protein
VNSNPKQLLVAIDGSPAASAAVDVAVEIAAGMGATLLFVHATSELANELFTLYPDTGPPLEDVITRDPVLAQAYRMSQAAGVEAEVEIMADDGGSADLAAAVAGTADGTHAAMIVTGSRGRSAIAGAILGSFSHNLIKYSTVPVLVVHERSSDRPAGGESQRDDD